MIFFTGDIPVEGLLSKGPLKELNFLDSNALWTGCLDAPWAMPSGSQRNATLSDGREVVIKLVYRPN